MKSILEESIITHFMTIQIIIHDFFSHNFSDNSKQKKYFLHVSPIIELSKKKNTNFLDISGWKHTQKKKKMPQLVWIIFAQSSNLRSMMNY